MMAGNPSWWSFSDKAQQPSAFLPPCPSLFPQFAPGSSSLLPFNSSAHHDHIQEFPFSQLLMGGLASEEGDDNKYGGSTEFQDQQKRLESWEEHQQQQQQQQILISPSNLLRVPAVFDVKQEESNNNCWSQLVMGGVSSSPRSSATTTTSATSSSSNILDFSNNKADNIGRIIHHPDHSSSECNSTAAGGVSKKARVHSSSTQPPLKVRKEKLGDRITALHQLVSPFGKTDTASVLLEAIGYIGFLQGQIEALSSPYLGNGPQNIRHQQSGKEDAPKDLSSRGLCLVPISCTQHVGSENGADYWAPAPGGGF